MPPMMQYLLGHHGCEIDTSSEAFAALKICDRMTVLVQCGTGTFGF